MPRKARIAKAQKAAKLTWQQKYASIGAPPTGDPKGIHLWMANASAILCHEAVVDFSTTDSGRERRRHAMQLIRWAVDTLEPAKLAAELNELYDAVNEGRHNAASIQGGEADESTSASDLL